MTMCGDESGIGEGVGVAVGEGLGVGVAVGVGVGDGFGVGVGVGAVPPRTTDTELLCTPSAVTINVHVPAPRNSADTST